MPKVKLTSSFLKETLSAPEPKDIDYIDSSTPGLIFRIQKGKATWYLRYSSLGKQRRMKLGDYPTLTLSEVRKIAISHLKDVTQGEDPLQKRNDKIKESKRLIEVAELWLEQLIERKKSKSYIRDNRYHIDIIRKDALGSMPISKIKVIDIEMFLKKHYHTPYRHNRLRSSIISIFRLALKYELIERSPAVGLPKAPEEVVDKVFTEQQFRSIISACKEIDTPSAHCILLMAYTGCRPSDAYRARWDGFDLHEKTWTRMASQTKQRKTQTVELADPAVDLVKQRVTKNGSPYLFPSDSASGHIQSVRKTWDTICKMARIEDGTLYMLRKYVATNLIKQGINVKQLQKIMAWEDASTPLKHYVKVSKGECTAQLNNLFISH